MQICDFCTAAKIILKFVADSKNINQLDFMYDLFKDFIESDEGMDFDFDNGLVCRWLNGTAKISSRITTYYSANGNIEAMSVDIAENIIPLLYDKYMATEEIYNLLMNDTTVSKNLKSELTENYSCESDTDIADFLSRVILFTMNRNFVKHDIKTKELLSVGTLSPYVRDYVLNIVPKPCRHFCGRENELEHIHTLITQNDKVFLRGVAGIGKSELAKMYAYKYKKEYTNILYFQYMGSIEKMIADCICADDTSETEEQLFEKHHRFLKSLKEDTLIIIDNFNVVPTNESIFYDIMQYRCKILFTTRSKFEDYTTFDVEEMSENNLLELVRNFYDSTEKDIDIVTQIINEVHGHTLSTELAARLLALGILKPKKLFDKLKKSKSVLNIADKINLIKDGKNTKATYYEHIHRLMYIAGLTGKCGELMRCMTFIPSEGIHKRIFADWLKQNDLNKINLLIEYGFIQENNFHKISLHPLIKEITLDDMKPSLKNCKTMITEIHKLFVFHGLDLPYHSTMFKTVENIILLAEKDDKDYVLFLKNAFAYMEKYAFEHGMKLIISELEKYASTNMDKALIYDYKSAYEHICNKDMKAAAEYELQAVNLCDEKANPHLASNIYANMGGIFHSMGDLIKAKEYMEKAYRILTENNLQYTTDSIAQIMNYANLAANLGEPQNAITALRKCTEYVADNSGSYAELLWNIGIIYLQMNDKNSAAESLKTALNIYSEIWSDEPELIEQKIMNLKETILAYGIEI